MTLCKKGIFFFNQLFTFAFQFFIILQDNYHIKFVCDSYSHLIISYQSKLSPSDYISSIKLCNFLKLLSVYCYICSVSAIMDRVMDFIQGALTTLSPDDIASLETCLRDLGVEGLDDMSEIKEEDLVPILKPIQARKLITKIKCRSSASAQTPDNSPPTTPTTPGRCLTPTRTPARASGGASGSGSHDTTSIQQHWARNFKIPWSSLAPGVQQAIEKKEHISPVDRRKFVSRVCDDIARITRLPGRSALRTIASQVVDKHPDTFMDKIPCSNEMLGNGYQSFLQAMENYMANHYSRGSQGQQKRGKSSTSVEENQRPAKSRHIDDYGCLNWEPVETEDENSLEEKQAWLKVEMAKREAQIDHEKVGEVVRTTFPSQRRLINNSRSLASLKQHWPVLFNMRYLCVHFELLMGFKISRLDDHLLSTGQGLLQLARDKLCTKNSSQSVTENFPGLQDLLSWYKTESDKGNSTWAAAQSVLPLLVLLLGDQVDAVFKLYPVS